MTAHRFPVCINITDPGADKRIPLLRVPSKTQYTVESAYVVPDTAVTGATDNYWQASLENGGTAGTDQAGIGGTAGGTAGWAANTPQEISITSGSGDLAEGEYLNLKYDENGTVAPGRFTVVLEVVEGVGAKA